MISLPIWLFVLLIVVASIPVVFLLYALIYAITATIWENKILKTEYKKIEKEK